MKENANLSTLKKEMARFLPNYMMNIYTRKEFRGNSVGETVVQYLINCAKEMHIGKIYLETSECGRGLYKKLGFADMIDYMKLTEGEQT